MNPLTRDEEYMKAALKLAEKAAALGEVPVGAVVVWQDQIIGEGWNQRETLLNPLAHAEIMAIKQACEYRGGWRLSDCTLYVTLEPCPMCAGAIINSRLDRVVWGAADPKAGSCGSLVDLFAVSYNHHPVTARGVLEEECAQVLKNFFADLRRRRREEKKQCTEEP